MFRQFFPAPGAGRDRYGAGAERFATGDIAGRIADNVDLLRGKLAAVLLLRPGPGKFWCWSLAQVAATSFGQEPRPQSKDDAPEPGRL